MDSDLQKGPVPTWPVIALTVEESGVVADPAGVGEPIRVAAYPDSASAARDAALAAAERLQVQRCRVKGTDSDGSTWWMVVDRNSGTLLEMEEPVDAAAPRRSSSRLLGAVPPRMWWVVGAAAATVVAVAVAAAIAPRETLPDPVTLQPAETVTEAATPPAGQLPVPAPTGWDTYATWVVEASEADAPAVLVGTRALVLSDGSNVFAVDPRTGVELWRSTAPARVTDLFVTRDGLRVYAAQDAAGVSVFDARSGEQLGDAPVEASAISLGQTPFAVLPGQSGAVLVDGEWSPRQVPATGIPVGVVGEGLVSVSVESQQLWVTTSNDPVLPAPIALMPPSDGLSLSRVVAFTRDRLVTHWVDNTGGSRQVVRVENVDEDGTLSPVGSEIELTDGYSGASVDGVHGLVGVGALLLDVETGTGVAAPSGSITVQAGYGWGNSGGRDRVRISPDGTIEPLPSSAVLPDVVLPDGRAVVRAPLGADSRGYYAISQIPPSPSPTAPAEPSAPSPSPTPTPTNGEQS